MSDLTHVTRTKPVRQFSILDWLRRRTAIARQRRALAGLTDAQLHDIGVTRAQAQAEARRPAWDAPQGWRQ